MPNYSCLDVPNGKNLAKNRVSTEAYIKQLETLLDTVAVPAK